MSKDHIAPERAWSTKVQRATLRGAPPSTFRSPHHPLPPLCNVAETILCHRSVTQQQRYTSSRHPDISTAQHGSARLDLALTSIFFNGVKCRRHRENGMLSAVVPSARTPGTDFEAKGKQANNECVDRDAMILETELRVAAASALFDPTSRFRTLRSALSPRNSLHIQ